jgi:hypothetical protein
MSDIKASIREAAACQRVARRSEQDVLRSLSSTGKLQRNLESLSDRQVGQLMFDKVWEAVPMTSPAMSISIEATERLFRSQAGARTEEEVFNHPDKLQVCPDCGQPMLLRYVGIGEPDYSRCESCGRQFEERQ